MQRVLLIEYCNNHGEQDKKNVFPTLNNKFEASSLPAKKIPRDFKIKYLHSTSKFRAIEEEATVKTCSLF